MRTALIVIFVSLFAKDLIAQDSTRHYFKEIGWTIHLPSDFKVLNSEQNTAIANNGKKGIEQALDTSVNLLQTINLVSARKSKNYFSATLTTNRTKTDIALASFIRSQEEAIYKAMSKDAKVDSSSTTMNIGKKIFRKFEMIVHINESKSFGMNVVTTFYNGYHFVIVYAYLDEVTQVQIETMLNESNFSK